MSYTKLRCHWRIAVCCYKLAFLHRTFHHFEIVSIRRQFLSWFSFTAPTSAPRFTYTRGVEVLLVLIPWKRNFLSNNNSKFGDYQVIFGVTHTSATIIAWTLQIFLVIMRKGFWKQFTVILFARSTPLLLLWTIFTKQSAKQGRN